MLGKGSYDQAVSLSHILLPRVHAVDFLTWLLASSVVLVLLGIKAVVHFEGVWYVLSIGHCPMDLAATDYLS